MRILKLCLSSPQDQMAALRNFSSFGGHFPPGIKIKVARVRGQAAVPSPERWLSLLQTHTRDFPKTERIARESRKGNVWGKVLLTPDACIPSSSSAAHNHSQTWTSGNGGAAPTHVVPEHKTTEASSRPYIQRIGNYIFQFGGII